MVIATSARSGSPLRALDAGSASATARPVCWHVALALTQAYQTQPKDNLFS